MMPGYNHKRCFGESLYRGIGVQLEAKKAKLSDVGYLAPLPDFFLDRINTETNKEDRNQTNVGGVQWQDLYIQRNPFFLEHIA